jgi:hypothetical protein
VHVERVATVSERCSCEQASDRRCATGFEDACVARFAESGLGSGETVSDVVAAARLSLHDSQLAV